MRKLVWLAVGFVIGCIPVAYFLWSPWFPAAGFLCFAAAVALLAVKLPRARIISMVLLGAFAAVMWSWLYHGVYLRPAREYDGAQIHATIEISDYSYETKYGGCAADGNLVLDKISYKVRVYLNEHAVLTPGTAVSGKFQLQLTTIDGQTDATYHQGKGIFLLAYAQGDVTVSHAPNVPAKYFPAKLRVDILRILDEIFPSDTQGFVRALLLGDSTKLTYWEDSAFRISGIRHIIAVSGLHVSILFALVYLLSGKHRIWTAVLCIPALFVFAAVAGFTPSIVRACVMQSLMILAMLFKKEYDPPSALAFAVIVILVCNPMSVTSVSFQLSVGCMVGIFLFCERLTNYFLRIFKCPKGMGIWAKTVRGICGSISVTLSAMAVTTPLCAWYFGSVSLIGVITNLVCLWVVSFVFYGIILACLLGAIWLPLGSVAAVIVAIPARFVLWVAQALAKVPLASVYTCSIYITLWLAFVYALFAIFLLVKKKHPGVFAACVAVGLVVSLTASWIEPRLDPMRVTVIDVGQGQSVLLQSRGAYYLVDCGGDTPESAADTITQLLLSQGITRLDGLILTHYDVDHAGGAAYLLEFVPADTLYLPAIDDDGNAKQTLAQKYEKDIQWVDSVVNVSGDWGAVTLIPGMESKDENECGLCILFQSENCDILIIGDRSFSGERALLNSMELPELELLVVGHHGAASSTGFELLSRLRPKNAVISVGAENRYGHPSEEVLDRLDLFGCKVYRTDLEGTIIFKR